MTSEDRDLRSLSPWTVFLPAIQYRSRRALRTDPTDMGDQALHSKKIAQSARLQPLDYGNLLNVDTMRMDPFYAISDLFQFYAHSKAQFLNIMDSKIISDTDSSFKNLYMSRFEENQGSHIWPFHAYYANFLDDGSDTDWRIFHHCIERQQLLSRQ